MFFWEKNIMLVHLSVKDIALLDSVAVDLSPGLTVLTGETGAGKSILVEALLLLLGARASAESVRTGASEGVVEGQLQLDGAEAREVDRVLASEGLPKLEDGALILRRVVSREGRHKQFVNGALATVAQVKAVAENLVDFTGQHAHQALLRPGAQCVLLDAFGDHESLLDEMSTSFTKLRDVERELHELRAKDADKEKRLDMLRFYLAEIDDLHLEPNEDEKLAAEHSKLKNAASTSASLAEARELIVDGSDDALTKLQRALVSLAKAARDDGEIAPLAKSLEEAVVLVDDVGRGLLKIGDIEADPERLEQVEARLDALKRLMRKHGGDLASVLAARDEMERERASLDGATEKIEELEFAHHAALDFARGIASKLSAKRKSAAKKLAVALKSELADLGMPACTVEVRVDDAELHARGADKVEVSFSANAGEAMAPLSKVASGGELSRVLLAVKRALLVKDPVPVSIFDEVDAGVGGAVADAIADKLRAVAEGRQVLVISHLAQIAAKADQHVVVEKAVERGRTVSRARLLDDDQRVDELARMIGGKVISDATRRHAEDMLARGKKNAKSKRRRSA
jgi:DNA repair protein RecN (Recombination protein N)